MNPAASFAYKEERWSRMRGLPSRGVLWGSGHTSKKRAPGQLRGERQGLDKPKWVSRAESRV